MLISEELHLLMLRPDGRGESGVGSYRAYGEVAAVIVDLVLHRRVTVTAEKHPIVHVVSIEPTGHPVMDAALARLAPLSGRKLSSLVSKSSLDPRDEVVQSLVAQNILAHGERGFFGLGAERTPEVDPRVEAALRSRLAAVLAGTATATEADITLLAVLQSMSAARTVLRVEAGDLSGRRLKQRIEQIADDSPAGDAVSAAVSAVISAAMMATMIPVIVAAGSN